MPRGLAGLLEEAYFRRARAAGFRVPAVALRRRVRAPLGCQWGPPHAAWTRAHRRRRPLCLTAAMTGPARASSATTVTRHVLGALKLRRQFGVVSERITIQEQRQTSGNPYGRPGAPLRAKEWMGHADASTTEVYAAARRRNPPQAPRGPDSGRYAATIRPNPDLYFTDTTIEGRHRLPLRST